ncbi:MAG: hypothetical protein ACI8UO_004256 [Verrucomicrobiales bacterium]|jgi:hypothetical protein
MLKPGRLSGLVRHMTIHRRFTKRFRSGFTLIEMTAAIMLAILAAGAGLALLNQNVVFLRMMQSFEFLRTEAPHINSILNQSAMRASSYRIYGSKQDAFSGIRAVNTGGNALRLVYRNPSGAIEESLFAFETLNGQAQLNFYYNDGTGWTPTPTWSVTRSASAVEFRDDSGILFMTLRGPAEEEITYATTTE